MADDDEQHAGSASPLQSEAVITMREGEIVVDVAMLLGAKQEATLVHHGERYRLRITSRGKLILTK